MTSAFRIHHIPENSHITRFGVYSQAKTLSLRVSPRQPHLNRTGGCFPADLLDQNPPRCQIDPRHPAAQQASAVFSARPGNGANDVILLQGSAWRSRTFCAENRSLARVGIGRQKATARIMCSVWRSGRSAELLSARVDRSKGSVAPKGSTEVCSRLPSRRMLNGRCTRVCGGEAPGRRFSIS